jgi:hypothetical protein
MATFDEPTHFWAVGQRFTYCGLSVRDKKLSPAPGCLECQAVIAQNEKWIAQLEEKDEGSNGLES